MKRSNPILTHASVFAIGIAAAVIATQASRNEPAATSEQETVSRGARAGSLENSDSTSPGTRRAGSADGRSVSKKEAKPATEQLADIVRITDTTDRQRALMKMIDNLAPDQFQAVAENFRALDHLGDSGGEYSLILRGWAKVDPLKALEFVAAGPNARAGSAVVLSTWAGKDAAAAEQWATAHHEGDGPNPYMVAVIRGIAGNDVAEASRLIQAMPRSNERGEAVDAITRALFLQGTDAALAYPASIQDEALRGGFVAAIADRLIEKDVNKAAAWVAAMPQGEIQNRAARDVGQALARVDATKAAAWVSTLKPEARVEAARGVIPVMSSTDIPGTAKWVSTLVGSPGYDNAVEEFVWSCNTRAPEQSAAWITGVSDPNQQRRLYFRMLGEWAQKDAGAVKQWVASNNVPPEVARRFSR